MYTNTATSYLSLSIAAVRPL